MAVTPRTAALLGLVAGGAAAAADAATLYNNRSEYTDRFQSSLRFPSDLNRNGNVPFMSMQFSAYRRRSINEQPFYESEMKINLPLPDGLVDQTSIEYQNANLDSVVGAAVEGASQALSGSGSIPGIAGTILSGTGAQTIQRLAGENVRNAASVLTGITRNPFQVVLFKSPNFRSHNFTWKFAPRDRAESETLNDIINTFKYHSLPGLSALGGVFFSYPEILEINFRPSDTYLYKFKPCVVESVTVNFAPNSPSFFRSTNAPTAVQFSIKVQEIEIWTKADYLRENGRFGNPISEAVLRGLSNPEETNLAASFPGQ
jgi:hypothetical protein